MPHWPTKAPKQLDERMIAVLNALPRYSSLDGIAHAVGLTRGQAQHTLFYLKLYFGVKSMHRIVHQAYIRRILVPTAEGYEERRKNQPFISKAQLKAIVALAKSEDMEAAGELIHVDKQTIKAHVYAVWRKWRELGVPSAKGQHRLIHLMWEHGYFWNKQPSESNSASISTQRAERHAPPVTPVS